MSRQTASAEWASAERRCRLLAEKYKHAQRCADKDGSDVYFARLWQVVDSVHIPQMANRTAHIMPPARRDAIAAEATWRAVERFDSSRGSSLLSYILMRATFELKKERARRLSERAIVRIPRAVAERYNATTARVIDWQQSHNGMPTAEDLGTSKQALGEYRKLSAWTMSVPLAVVVDDGMDGHDVADMLSMGEQDMAASMAADGTSYSDVVSVAHAGLSAAYAADGTAVITVDMLDGLLPPDLTKQRIKAAAKWLAKAKKQHMRDAKK